ncbi:MAG: hypothetical protein R3D03_14215 [Geminicoccaceae bacterium]
MEILLDISVLPVFAVIAGLSCHLSPGTFGDEPGRARAVFYFIPVMLFPGRAAGTAEIDVLLRARGGGAGRTVIPYLNIAGRT